MGVICGIALFLCAIGLISGGRERCLESSALDGEYECVR